MLCLFLYIKTGIKSLEISNESEDYDVKLW